MQAPAANLEARPEIRSSASLSDYYLDVPNSLRLFLIYTLRCNFACSHCLVSSSPERREKMDLDFACRVIDAAIGSGIRVIYLTGGEVFLYYKDLLQLVQRASAGSAASVVETNGSWATTRATTLRKLRQLQDQGLSCLALSLDRYHLEFGTLDRCLTLIETAREVELPCRVLVVASPDQTTDRQIAAELDRRDVPFFYEAVMTLGRGRELGEHTALLQRRRCDSIGVTVLPDGEVLSCAGAYNGHRALRELPLYAGNATAAPREILDAERGNLIARAIDERGHGFLLDLLPAALRERTSPPDAHESLCGFCHKLLGNQEVVAHLRAALSSLASPPV